MHIGKGQVFELILEDGFRHVRVSCPSDLIPVPGQYLLAGDGSDSPLPVPLFHTDSVAQGFIAAAPIPDSWHPGTELHLRGPLGHGFDLPLSARKVGLIALDVSPARLRGLILPALKQDAAVVIVCKTNPDHLPDEVEVHPVSALNDIVAWADYLAFDIARENLNQLKERLGKLNPVVAGKESQVLVRTAIPCGGIAECGICAVTLKSTWKLACKDGPVFDWRELE
jgi:2-polyprenylphenol hydroxylase and related flavodoxin oxidoreductases